MQSNSIHPIRQIQMEISNRPTRVATLLFLVALSFYVVSPAFAQLAGGIITGSVRDNTGAVISKATIRVLNVASGVEVTLSTNNSGSFTTATLRPGNYQVSASSPGFQTTVEKNVVLQIASRPVVNLVLKVGEAQQTVEVTAGAPAMQLTEATVGTVVGERAVQELPLNGRSALALTLYTPGVRNNSATNPEGFADRGSAVTAMVINNGGGQSMNANLLDGEMNLNVYSGEIAINISADAAQEFKVQSGYMPADFGLTSGGVIAVSTKSGTNKYHGDIYEYFRNNYLDARDWFLLPGTAQGPLRYNQYGASVGGPVLHNKLFFFGNYEEFRYLTSSVFLGSVPAVDERKGDFSKLVTCAVNSSGDTVVKQVPIYDPNTTTPSGKSFIRTQFPGNIINRPLDPVAVAYQNAIYPLPNTTSSDPCQALTNTNNYQTTKANHRSMREAVGRIDYQISNRQSAFVRYAYYHHFTDNGNAYSFLTAEPVAYRNDSTTNQGLLLEHTFIFTPSLINEFRVGFTRTYFPYVFSSYGQNWPAKLGFPSNVPATVLPEISGNGLPAVTGQTGLRVSTNPEVTDVVTLLRGHHSIRFGGDWMLPRSNYSQGATPSGVFSFSSALTNLPSSTAGTGNAYASFLLGAVNSATLPVYTMSGYWQWAAAGFVQDDWKVTPRLTINAGLRYDFQAANHEHHNGGSNFAPNAISPNTGLKGILVYANTGGYGSSFIPNAYNDWGPRLGFAWDVFGDRKTSLRAGFGIYYVNLTYNAFITFGTDGFGSTSTSYTSSNPGIVPATQLSSGFPYAPLKPLGVASGPDFLLGQSVSYRDPSNSHTPMSQQWNLDIQHQFPSRFVVDIGYEGNHGVHMPWVPYNLNMLPDADLSLGLALTQNVPNPYAGKVPGSLGAATITRKQSLLPYPYYSSISAYCFRNGQSHGDMLNVSVQRHSGSGLTLMASYTLSKMLDDSLKDPANTYPGISDQDGNMTPQNSNDLKAEYSLDQMDIKHRIVASALYELPFGRGKRFLSNSGGFMNRLVGGWQVNAIVRVQSGLPIVISGANNGIATRPSWVPGKSAKDVNLSKRGVNGWFNTTVFENPDSYTYGNVSRVLPNSRGPKYADLDGSIFKTVQLPKHTALQIHLEAFNAFNHPNFGQPNGTFVPASGNNGRNSSSSFGTITSDIQPRNVQLAAKIIF